MKTLLLNLILFPVIAVYAQKKQDISFYMFDKNWKGCKKAEDAAFLAQRKKINDTTYRWMYYNFTGPLVSIETYKDEDATVPNGFMAYYGADGKIDSCGNTASGKKDAWWYYYTDSLTIWQKKKYDNGKLLEHFDTLALRLEREENAAKHDSSDVLAEASFKGGDSDWMKYIQKRISFPDRTRNIGKGGQVIIGFAISSTGKVFDLNIEQSVEYAIDNELINIIENSPAWKPVSINGKSVKAYRRQPITVRF